MTGRAGGIAAPHAARGGGGEGRRRPQRRLLARHHPVLARAPAGCPSPPRTPPPSSGACSQGDYEDPRQVDARVSRSAGGLIIRCLAARPRRDGRQRRRGPRRPAPGARRGRDRPPGRRRWSPSSRDPSGFKAAYRASAVAALLARGDEALRAGRQRPRAPVLRPRAGPRPRRTRMSRRACAPSGAGASAAGRRRLRGRGGTARPAAWLGCASSGPALRPAPAPCLPRTRRPRCPSDPAPARRTPDDPTAAGGTGVDRRARDGDPRPGSGVGRPGAPAPAARRRRPRPAPPAPPPRPVHARAPRALRLPRPPCRREHRETPLSVYVRPYAQRALLDGVEVARGQQQVHVRAQPRHATSSRSSTPAARPSCRQITAEEAARQRRAPRPAGAAPGPPAGRGRPGDPRLRRREALRHRRRLAARALRRPVAGRTARTPTRRAARIGLELPGARRRARSRSACAPAESSPWQRPSRRPPRERPAAAPRWPSPPRRRRS